MSNLDRPATWRVQHQVPRTRISGSGVATEGYDVTVMTGRNHTGTVFIPAADYGDLERVKAELASLASQLDAVGSLTDES